MPNFRERIAGVFAAASSTGVALRVTGDTQDRIVIDAGGRISWGSGSAAADATIERSSTSVVRITNALVVDTAGTSAFSRTVVLKNSGQTSVSFGAFPWEWSTSLQLQSNDSSRWLWLNAGSNNGTYNSRIRAGNTGLDIYVGGTSANNGTHVLTAATSGRVGIGTTSPSYTLDVVGNVNISANGYYRFGSGDAEMGASGYSLVFRTYDGVSALLERVRITSNGNVGIGTSSPAVKLDVSDGAGWFRRTANNLQTALQLGRMDDGLTTPLYLVQTDDTNGDILRFYSNRWGSNVRFARSGPSGDRDMVWIDGGNGTGATVSVFNASNTVTARIHGAGNTYFNGGNVGIGTTSPASILDVNGTISIQGATAMLRNGNYHVIHEPAGGAAIYLGNTTDQGNYYDNSWHYFRNRGGGTTYGTFGSAGLSVSGRLAVGTTIITTHSAVIAAGTAGSGLRAGLATIGHSGSGYPVVGDGVRFTATNDSYQYDRNDFAAIIDFAAGGFNFRTAPVGTAGNTATFTSRMSITNAGAVTIPGSLTVSGTLTGSLTGNAATATRLASSVNIGDVAFNGTASIVPQRIFYKDTRNDNYNPYTHVGVSLHLKANSTDGLFDGGTYHGVLDLVRWSDSSGGKNSQIAVTDNGNIYIRTNATNTTWNAWSKVWTDTNDGAGSGLDADQLDGQQGSWYASFDLVESVLGDLMNVGTYNATPKFISNKSLTGNTATLTTTAAHGFAVNDIVSVWGVDSTFDGERYTITAVTTNTFSYAKTAANVGSTASGGSCVKKPVPQWSEGSTTYRHGMYWVVANGGTIKFPTIDLSSRDEAVDGTVTVSNGDWIVAHNPSFNPLLPNANLTESQIEWKWISFSAESYVNEKIDIHVSSTLDPHSAAGYLTRGKADPIYSQIGHNHDFDISTAIANHKIDPNAHAQYAASNVVTLHTALPDPHPQYLTEGEGDGRYTIIGHNHNDLYYTKTQVDTAIATIPAEVFATETAAVGKRIFVGSNDPSLTTAMLAGDLWIETQNVSLTSPGPVASLAASSPNGTTVNLSWQAWPSGLSVTRIVAQRRDGTTFASPADSGATTILNATGSPPTNITFTDTGRSENTDYSYRVFAVNSASSVSTISNASLTSNIATITTSTQSPAWAANQVVTVWGVNSTFDGTFTILSSPAPSATSFSYARTAANTSASTGFCSRLVSVGTPVTVRTVNDPPPVPSSVAAPSGTITTTQIVLNWAAPTLPFPDPAANRYEVFLNGTSQATTNSTTYTFTGLTPSTQYTVGVRSRDNAGLNSAIVSVNATTNAATPPDTTPPGAPTINYFKPVGSYGRMEVSINWGADTVEGELVYYPGNNAAPTTVLVNSSSGSPRWVSGSPNTTTYNFHTYTPFVTEAAGQTPRVVVRARDNATTPNWTAPVEATYTLIASPYLLSADASNSWRNEAGGRYNWAGNKRVYQGFFSASNLNSIGLWYYGTKIAEQVNNSQRTFTNIEIYMKRNTGGDGVDRHVFIAMHDQLTDPGNQYTTAPTLYNNSGVVTTGVQVTTGTGLAWGGGFQWCQIPSAWWTVLTNGTRKGIAVRNTTAPIYYVILDSVGENNASGQLRFTHLG